MGIMKPDDLNFRMKLPEVNMDGMHESAEERQEAARKIIEMANKPKPWKERNWLLIAIGTYILGLFTPIIQKSIEQKILPQSNPTKQAIQVKIDSPLTRKK